ncbi:unnamed protein product [Ectocarpus sp. CCAP 1310/34]|nr:unnamed protein product [Ectocarpus sp. CCAP 1310/34]
MAGLLCASAGSRARSRTCTHALHCATFRRGYAAAARPTPPVAAARVEFVVTLERAVVTDTEDGTLWKSGVFDAEIHPDLPPAGTMAGLVRYYLRRAKAAVFEMRPDRNSDSSSKGEKSTGSDTDTVGRSVARDGIEGGYLVRTVPVQLSRQKARDAACADGVDAEGAKVPNVRPADALLLVSGSHPGRRLPFAKSFLMDVYDELRLATSMRNSGHLPKGLALWAVANPLTEVDEAGIDRVRKKVELGAEVILTQPPLAWELFERWLQGVHTSGALGGSAAARNDGLAKPGEGTDATMKMFEASGSTGEERSTRRPTAAAEGQRGGDSTARILVGLPVITAPKGLRFWLNLCGLHDNPGVCKQAFEAFGHPSSVVARTGTEEPHGHPAGEKQASAVAGSTPSPYGQEWLETTMLKLKSLDGSGLGVAGVHLMAPGRAPRRRAIQLAAAGFFGEPR